MTNSPVVDVTGGHPGCIMQILEKELAARNFAIVMDPSKEDYFFSHSERVRMFEQYLEPALRQILRGVDQPIIEALSTLFIFRRFNEETLNMLVRSGYIEWDGSVSDLLSRIVQTHLIDTPRLSDPMYADNLSRRMLAKKVRIFSREHYQALNQLALRMYTCWTRGLDLHGKSLPYRPIGTFQIILTVESIYHLLELLLLENRSRNEVLGVLRNHLSAQLVALDISLGMRGSIALLQDALQRDRELMTNLVQALGESGEEEIFRVLDDFASSYVADDVLVVAEGAYSLDLAQKERPPTPEEEVVSDISQDYDTIRRQLRAAQRTLDILEEQAAAIPPLVRDVMLVRNLEDQRQIVAELRKKLAECTAREKRS